MITRDEAWVCGVIARAETVDECRLAVAVYFAGRHGKPLLPIDGIPIGAHIEMLAARYIAVCNDNQEGARS